MTNTEPNEALSLAKDCDLEDHFERRVNAELKRLYVENVALRGEVEMLYAAIAELESQLEAVGAGGVGPLMPAAALDAASRA